MDQKKRRNSILKKPTGTDDENTTEITTKLKRRISFSGKKSVKEFLAGEEQATIWGTSYEESAECMQLNAAETGVVGVNDKRIVLRNRRVVVEAKTSNKRRSKKRVCVADNDKENVFTQTPQVEIEPPSDPVSVGTSNKGDSPVKSELMLVKSHVPSGRTVLDHLDALNACSTTFDFINYSGAINKTVTIEQSVDVSLDENELQMFKFRVPVSGADVSPNLSVVRDGSSPNIFSSSILMSDDDMKMLKLMKVQMGGLISTGEHLKMIESGERNQNKCTDLVAVHNASGVLPKQSFQGKAMDMSIASGKSENDVEDAARSLEAKTLKRKTIRAVTNMEETSVWPDRSAKSHTIIMEAEMIDVHSPMRKKPMHKQLDKPMDISAVEQKGPPRRQTVHFESAAMDESRNDEVILCEESVCIRTIHFDQNQIHEDTICEENDGPAPTARDDHVAMELSLVDETVAEMVQDTTAGVTKKRHSIHGPVDILEESPKKGNEPGRAVKRAEEIKRQSVYTPVDIAEDSPKQEKTSQSRRLSVHIPTDIVEDSPKSAREREVLKPKSNNRQTSYNADMVQDASVLCMPRKGVPSSDALRRTIMAAVDMVCDPQDVEKSTKMRQSIYTPSDMIEEELGATRRDRDFKEIAKHQKSIYASLDMVEDSPKRINQSCTKPAGQGSFARDQKSICAPNEMMELTSKFAASREMSAVQSFKERKSVYTPSDMVEESPKAQKSIENRVPLDAPDFRGPALARKSIYTASDMIEESPKMQKSIENRVPLDAPTFGGAACVQKSIYASQEVMEATSKLATASTSRQMSAIQSFKERKSIYTPSDMVEESPKRQNSLENRVPLEVPAIRGPVLARKSIYTASDMVEESPKVQKTGKDSRPQGVLGTVQDRKSIYTPTEMVEDSPKMVKVNETTRPPAVQGSKCVAQARKSIYTAADMVEDSPKPAIADVRDLTGVVRGRQSTYNPADMIEDSPKVERQADVQRQTEPKSIYIASDVTEDSFVRSEAGKPSSLKRQSIYTAAEMVEDSPKASPTSRTLQRQLSAFDASPDGLFNQKSRHSVSIRADSPLEDQLVARAPLAQSICQDGHTSQKIAKNCESLMASYSLETSKPRAVTRQTTYAPADIVEDSPPRMSTSRKPDDTQSSAGAYSFKTRPPEATNRMTICAPSDILEDSPKSAGHRSIYTPADMMEDSPKVPDATKPPAGPKVVVRHMTLQPGLMGDNAAMRVLKNQQTKAKIAEPVQLNESTMDVSVVESAPLPTTRPNFCKLNEQLMKGEVKTFADERRNKQSLFDRLEMAATEGAQFDSFHKQLCAVTGFPMQPRKNSFNDYTLELTRNTFDGQRRRGNDYTMEMSSRMHSKVDAIDQETRPLEMSSRMHSKVDGVDLETRPLEMSSRMHLKVEAIDHHSTHSLDPDDDMNLSVQMPPTSSGAPRATSDANRSTAMPGNAKRQTIHFHDEDEMDVSVSVKPQDAAKSQPNRQTIHFHEHFELDTQTYRNPVTVSTAFEKNPRTIHFEEDNNMDESGHVMAEQTAQDVLAGDDDLDVEPVKENRSCQGNLTRQSCIMRTSHLDAAPEPTGHSRKTIHAPVAMLEETMGQQHDIMELSTSICPEPLESKRSQRSQFEATSFARQRRTIHCHDDLELDDTASECPSLAHASRMSSLKTSHNADEPQRLSAIPTRVTGRKTILLNQDLELDDKTEKLTENLRKPPTRHTAYFQQNDDMDESVVDRPDEVKSDNEFHCKEDVSKGLPKPRRMTTFEDIPVDVEESPEKTTLRKSSFSRTLNFYEMAKATTKLQSMAQKDSPLVCFNPRLKRCESTTEIDRSLAEYLKAEAAATLYRCSPDHMVMDVVEQSPQSVYYDAEEEQAERKEFLLEDDHVLEESGMQPLQKTASRRDIEDCVADEVAAKQDQSDMSFELRGVRANRLNHEFFDKEVSMSPEPEPVEEVRRQTILEPAPMMAQSDAESMSPEAPAKPIAPPGRKTIHFTNEDAVDESFFDENLSRPAAAAKLQTNRQTVYFNESQNSIDDMDASLTQPMPETPALSQSIGRSKAAQSMKEILRESNLLFTQSMLKPHLFETQKPTVYFDSKDMTLDTVPVSDNPPKADENAECTPTKATKSRIPQLIGSAKKLQSIKKSMDFFQQKLPILNSSVQAKDEDALARQVDSALAPTETSFGGKPQQLQESFETVEIPRKVVASGSKELQESFETVEIPRRATTFQRNDTLYLCQNEVDITNISQKSNFRFEDVPITISDVSTYFAQKPPAAAKPAKEATYSPNTTEALCNLDMNKFADDTQLPKSSDSEDTAYNFDKFKKRYVELTCDSINSTGCNEDIEKTHLSLVNTLDEHESELVRETCSQLPQETTAFSTSVCRKCKRHKQTVSQNDTTLSSFVLAPLTEAKLDLAALKELSRKPRVFDVAKIWRQNLRESDSFNFSDGRSAIDLEDDDTMDTFIASLDNERRMAAQQRQRKEFKQQASFVHTVRKKLQSKKSNWILNDLLLMQNILRFTHSRLRTFAIFISFTQKDPRGVEVEFNEMRIVQNTHHSRVWTAFEYALHYQLLVELPFDLSTLCPTTENLFQLLDHVEGVTQDVLKIGKDVLYLVLSSPASLIREPSGGIYIRKYTRTRTAQNEVKRTEFQIEVRNMKRLSYESITQPPLYEFDEKIQLLPTGQDFLRVFLADPLRYMKS